MTNHAADRQFAMVTGGARGIGRAIAERLAGAGWQVGIYDVDADNAERTAREIGGQAVSGHLDVTDRESWTGALADVSARTGGHLHLLVNNAGVASSGPFESMALGKHLWMLDINFRGLLTGCHCAFDLLKATNGARVINLASASALYGSPSLATYSATKFGVRGLTEALNIEWERHDIQVMDLMPIFVKGPMVDAIGDIPSVRELGVKLTPDDVAHVALAAVTRRHRRVHWVVGRDAKLLKFAMRLMPERANRWAVRRLSVE